MFLETSGQSKDGLVLIYDLENFTKFLAVPDIQRHVSAYFNFVDEQARAIFGAGNPVWHKKRKPLPPVLSPIHEKFLGDGMMFIFDLTGMEPGARSWIVREICNRSLNTKFWFEHKNKQAMDFVPVAALPPRIRFGITYGTIHELTRTGGAKEYVGFAINLAARLQKYSGSASFLASARLPEVSAWFKRTGYVRVQASRLRNAPDEFVYIYKDDLDRAMQDPDEKDLFVAVEATPSK